jgi:hypothetical protein
VWHVFVAPAKQRGSHNKQDCNCPCKGEVFPKHPLASKQCSQPHVHPHVRRGNCNKTKRIPSAAHGLYWSSPTGRVHPLIGNHFSCIDSSVSSPGCCCLIQHKMLACTETGRCAGFSARQQHSSQPHLHRQHPASRAPALRCATLGSGGSDRNCLRLATISAASSAAASGSGQEPVQRESAPIQEARDAPSG